MRKEEITFPPMKGNYWLADDPVKTHFINALQATFPEGERFFIEAARDAKEIINDQGNMDKDLAEDFKLFISQEGIHSVKHEQWNKALIDSGYVKIRKYDEILRKLKRWFRIHFTAKARIAMTAGVEHYTASLAWLFMYVEPSMLREAEPPFNKILLYHAMEEVEHKAVCFDLYNSLYGGYFTRIFWFTLMSLDIAVHVYIRFRHLMKEDGLWNREYRKESLHFFFGKERLLRKMWPQIKKYYRPSFHPWEKDERRDFEKEFGSLREKLGIEPFEGLQ
jgi:predicted metal-dependent hydrolase